MDIQILGSGSAGNAYHVTDGKTRILLDCGLPFGTIQEALNHTATQLDGVLITHEHGDHIKAAKQFMRYGVNLYATKGTFEAAKLTGHRCKTINPEQKFKVGTLNVLPFHVEHDAADPVGFFIQSDATIETLLYLTDTFYSRYRFKTVNYLMLEINYDQETLDEVKEQESAAYVNRVYGSHMSLNTALELIQQLDMDQLRHVYVLHMSDSHGHAERIKTEVQKATGVPVTIC